MKTMKKAMALALSAMMLVAALTGCGSSKTPAASGSGSGSQAGSSAAELDYPKQNINVVVQYSAGGGTDLSVRGVLDGVKDVPVNFSVSNVTGNGGLIGLTQVANSKADGYTLGVVNTDFIINMVLGNTDMTLDTFSPLACALRDPFVLIIGNNENYSTLEEFVDYAKAHPGEIVVGETGTGAAPTRIRDNVGIPIELALAAADQRRRDEGIRSTVSLVAAGSFRCSSDVIKAIALGADAVYIASAPLIAMGSHMCQTCNTGK